MTDDKEVTQYCEDVLDMCVQKNDEISKMKWEMEDIKDTWADAQNRINQAVNKKAIEHAELKATNTPGERSRSGLHDAKMALRSQCLRQINTKSSTNLSVKAQNSPEPIS